MVKLPLLVPLDITTSKTLSFILPIAQGSVHQSLPPMRGARVGRGPPLILHKINTLLMESDSDDSGDELKQFEVDCESVEYISERERGTAARQADTFDGQLPPRE